ncbi:MAG TPA: septum formation family protein [Acidimicrobiia bacterium]|nr:septum formation family protein [Acidimicrobiia bacterium]
MWLAGIAVLALLASGCDGGTDEAGAATLFHLQTGDCFRSSAGTAGRTVEIEDVTTIPCAESHDGEVFAVVTYPAAKDAPYPGDEAVADFASSECLAKFPAYTGASYDDSDLQVATVRPDRDSWADKDDREAACVLYKQGSTLAGSRRKP